MAPKQTPEEKAKDFELDLDAYGEAHKAGNVSMKETYRLKLLKKAGLETEQSESNSPKTSQPPAAPAPNKAAAGSDK